MYIFLKKLIII